MNPIDFDSRGDDKDRHCYPVPPGASIRLARIASEDCQPNRIEVLEGEDAFTLVQIYVGRTMLSTEATLPFAPLVRAGERIELELRNVSDPPRPAHCVWRLWREERTEVPELLVGSIPKGWSHE